MDIFERPANENSCCFRQELFFCRVRKPISQVPDKDNKQRIAGVPPMVSIHHGRDGHVTIPH